MSDGLEKILKLAKKTGDNVIVFNPAKPKDSYVILAIKAYEKLLDNQWDNEDLTGGFDADKINPDIEDNWLQDDEIDDLTDEEEDDGWQDWPSAQDQEEVLSGNFEEVKEEGDPEKVWEEEVNYLYPTEEETAVLAKENNSDFDSIASILEQKRQKKTWNEPLEAPVENF